jgi:hypothetical protein
VQHRGELDDLVIDEVALGALERPGVRQRAAAVAGSARAHLRGLGGRRGGDDRPRAHRAGQRGRRRRASDESAPRQRARLLPLDDLRAVLLHLRSSSVPA